MKSRHFFCITTIIATIFLTSCQNAIPTEDEKPIYNQPSISTPVSVSSMLTTDNTNEALPKEEGIFADFQGVEVNIDTPKPAASASNSRYVSQMSLVCYAEDIDTVFYVNYGEARDNFLYAYKDGKSELVVEKYANHINYKDGNIYFVAGDRPIPTSGLDFSREKGIFYQYNLTERTLSQILDTEIYNLSIYSDGFYFYTDYSTVSDSGILNNSSPVCYCLPFGGSVPEEISPFLPIFYGEYQLVIEQYDYESSNPGKIKLSSETNEYIILQNGDFAYTPMFIEGDKLWISTGNVNNPSITSINLKNGVIKEYNLDSLKSYTVMDGVLFAAAKGIIYRYDDKEDTFVKIVELPIRRNNIHQLSTDGKYLYLSGYSNAVETAGQQSIKNYYFTQYTVNADGSITETELSQ